MELIIHGVKVKEFIKLIHIMTDTTEWQKNDDKYMSGHIAIKDLKLSVFSCEYPNALNLTDTIDREDNEQTS